MCLIIVSPHEHTNPQPLHPGVLSCLDGYMNIALEQTEEHVNGKVLNRYGDAFIRGNNGTPTPSSSLDHLPDVPLFQFSISRPQKHCEGRSPMPHFVLDLLALSGLSSLSVGSHKDVLQRANLRALCRESGILLLGTVTTRPVYHFAFRQSLLIPSYGRHTPGRIRSNRSPRFQHQRPYGSCKGNDTSLPIFFSNAARRTQCEGRRTSRKRMARRGRLRHIHRSSVLIRMWVHHCTLHRNECELIFPSSLPTLSWRITGPHPSGCRCA